MGGGTLSKSADKIAAAHSSLMALLESRVISTDTKSQVDQVRETVEQELTDISRTSEPDIQTQETASSEEPKPRKPLKS